MPDTVLCEIFGFKWSQLDKKNNSNPLWQMLSNRYSQDSMRIHKSKVLISSSMPWPEQRMKKEIMDGQSDMKHAFIFS